MEARTPAALMRIYTHPACLRHDPGGGHPESPARLAAVLQALEPIVPAPWHEAPCATREQLARVHAPELIALVLDEAPGFRRLDPDTAMSPHSAEAALRAAGAVCAAVDAVSTGQCLRAFCAVRPPGHHATSNQAMGFCLFNSVAVAAAQALAHGVQRVAIVDFDVHHGNGTQEIFWNEPRVLYASCHQQALYPGSGHHDELGGGNNIRNAPLPEGSGGGALREVWNVQLRPDLEAFAPELLLVSAGFDAHRLDPLAGLEFDTDDYAWLTEELVGIADRHSGGRLVSALEGGYSLTALRECSAVHVGVLARARE